ncbi:hypothetical protein LP418_19700 [Nocardioides sp. B-3]|nr:hypothetical protein [Nocardioides sp. B-3]UUZ58400.1 hypothetical protein LP418_19700 [Nocardioides sp. B-3]
MTHLGRRLSEELYAPVQAALAAGGVHVDQAWVIVKAVDAVPAEHGDVKPAAVDHLLIAAKDHDAKALKVPGRRIPDTVAPEVGEAAEAKALADEEAAAARKVTLTLRDHPNGTTTGKFTLPTAGAGEMLRKQLMAIAAPQHQNATRDPDPKAERDARPLHERLGWAFIEWIERYAADRLPTSGGVSATVVVTMGPGHADGWPGCGVARHRWPDQRRTGPAARVRGRDHPGRARRGLGGPRPRPHPSVPHQGSAGRDRAPRRWLHRRGV